MWYPPPRQKVLKVFERLGLGLYFGWWLVIFRGSREAWLAAGC